jgi:hypothetical protein
MKEILLTHYYLPDRKPFLNLSALSEDELKNVLEELREKTKRGESKRVFMDWYVDQRKETEKRIVKEFISKGGKPEKKYPHYFILGESIIQKSTTANMKEIIIPLSEISSEIISFTYPDSMASFDLEKDPKYKMPYHGKVFTLEEIREVIREYKMPADEIGFTSRYGYPKYIEAQLWSDKPIQEFLR